MMTVVTHAHASLNAMAVTAFWWPAYSLSITPVFTFHSLTNESDDAEINIYVLCSKTN